MLLTLLASTGLMLFMLLVLCLVCGRFPVLGDGIAFVCVFAARLLVKFQWFAEAAAALFAKASQASLNYPPGATDEVWYGLYVIARILLFAVSTIILTGDLYSTLQSTPLLFGGVGAVALPGSFAIPSALLFVMMGALYGITGLDCANVTPSGVHLFPNMTVTVKKWLGIACLGGFLLSLVFAVLFWAYRGWFLSDPETAGVLVIPLLALVGLLLTGASVLALWGLVVGLTGVLTLVFWIAYCGCIVVAGIFSLVPALLDVLTVHLSGGERTVYERYLPGLPYQVPNTWFHRRTSISPDANAQHISTPDEQTTTSGFPISAPIESEVHPMHDGFFGITLNGVLGSQLKHGIQVSFAGCKKLVRASGRVGHLNQTTQSIGLGIDCSATTYALMGQKLVEAFLDSADVPLLLHVLDAAEGISAIQMLRDVKRRLPQSMHIVLTAVSHDELQHPPVQAFLNELTHLHHEGVLATTLLLETDSPLARLHGDVKFYEYVARVLADLAIAPLHSGNNLAAVAVFNELGRTSAFVSLAFDTTAVASGETKKQWLWLKWFTSKAVTGSLDDMLTQSLAVTKDLLEKEKKSACDQPVSHEKPCFLLHDVPLSLADRRFSQFEERNAQQIKQHFPNAHTLTISGSPVPPVCGSSSPFRLGVSCLYPIPCPVVEAEHTSHSEEREKDEKHPAFTALPANTVRLNVPASPPDALASNGSTNGRVGGRSRRRKEQ